jgi:hypothetical protein
MLIVDLVPAAARPAVPDQQDARIETLTANYKQRRNLTKQRRSIAARGQLEKTTGTRTDIDA